MKFGHFCLPSYFADTYPSVGHHMRHLVDFMASSEELGFDALWANEHHFHAYGGHIASPPIMLAALAQRTKRIRLGTSIIVLPLHNPIEIAEQMAMIDLMSGGRVDFGIGRGFVLHDHETFGIQMSDAQARLNESLEVILKAWTGEPFTHHGPHFNYDNITVWPKPEQDPPPVWMACSNNPDSFANAGRQGYNLLTVAYLKPLPKLGELTSIYRDNWVASGRNPSACELGTHYQVVLDENGARARARAEEALRRYAALLRESLAQASDVHAALRHSNQEGIDIDKLVDEGRLAAGTPDEIVAMLERAQDELGVTIVDCSFMFGGITYEEADRSIKLFASEVMPKLKSRQPNWKAQLVGAR